jgi:hypothetical protein
VKLAFLFHNFLELVSSPEATSPSVLGYSLRKRSEYFFYFGIFTLCYSFVLYLSRKEGRSR